MKKDELEKAWKEAVSFPDSKPPGKEIGRKRVNGRTYIFYKDDKGNYFYSSVPGLKFAKQMEDAMKKKKKEKLRCTGGTPEQGYSCCNQYAPIE